VVSKVLKQKPASRQVTVLVPGKAEGRGGAPGDGDEIGEECFLQKEEDSAAYCTAFLLHYSMFNNKYVYPAPGTVPVLVYSTGIRDGHESTLRSKIMKCVSVLYPGTVLYCTEKKVALTIKLIY